MVMFAWSSGIESTPRQHRSAAARSRRRRTTGAARLHRFPRPDMDADIEAMEKRARSGQTEGPLWADMQRIYAEQLPVLPLFFRSEAHVCAEMAERRTCPPATTTLDAAPCGPKNWHAE
jgi:peptide/nickel transport system substrate-binding protein